jgi:4-hydroxybenzoate polyprenyltransferase
MSIEFPTEVAAYRAPFAVAFAVAILVQILKPQLKDWRWTNIASLGLSEVLAMLAALIEAGWRPDGALLFSGAMVGLFGAGLAVLGYETVVNILGLLGKGSRSERALQAQARRMCGPRPQ